MHNFIAYFGHIGDGVSVVHQLSLIHLDFTQWIDGKEKLALMSSHPTGNHPLHQFRVLVDEPRFTQYICRRVFQLYGNKKYTISI